MIKEKIESINAMVKKESNGKKKIENLVVFIIILIITILVINIVWKPESSKTDINTSYANLASNNQQLNEKSNITLTNEYNLEHDLEEMLSKISGAGKVKVLLTYSESSQVVPISNEKYKETQTEENDKTGGKRTIDEIDKTTEVIYKENSGGKEIVTQKVIMPKMEGALVLAEGANNANVKTNLIQAVEALTGLATHKIQVLQMNS